MAPATAHSQAAAVTSTGSAAVGAIAERNTRMQMPQGMIANIIENPFDDAPRLIYADWLEERGEPRGEFIRVQCELADLPEDSPRHVQLKERETELLQEYYDVWTAPYEGLSTFANAPLEFHRGLTAEISMAAGQFLQKKNQTLLRENLPLSGCNRLQLWDKTKRVEQLSQCESLQWFPAFEWLNGNLDDAGMKALAASPWLDRLWHLRLYKNRYTNKGLSALATPKALPALRRLELAGGTGFLESVDHTPIAAILKTHPHLNSLSISHLPGVEMKKFLRAAKASLPQLRHLHLGNQSEFDLLNLAKCDDLVNLESLHVVSDRSVASEADLTRFLENPHFENLREFTFENGSGQSGKQRTEILQRVRERFPDGEPRYKA